MVTFISNSPEETAQLGRAWGETAGPGSVIALTGDLGAGKTELVKGLARGLQIPDRVYSPTFTLVHEYQGGRLPLYHLDLYRLEHPEQIAAAGLADYFYQRQGVTVVEWADRWPWNRGGSPSEVAGPQRALDATASASRPPVRHVTIELAGDRIRRITYDPAGP